MEEVYRKREEGVLRPRPLSGTIGPMAIQGYFDNAATTALSPRAAAVWAGTASSYPANPSASYPEGRRSKERLEEARSSIATRLGVSPKTLFFTSGATESAGTVLSSLLWAKTPGDIVLGSIEHEAVLGWAPLLKEKGWNVITLDARGGFYDPGELRRKMTPETRMVCLMAVSNALGTVQPTKDLVEAVRSCGTRRPVFFYSDSVQALGKTGLDLPGSGVDGAGFSAHKIHGPRGIGLLYLKKGSIQSLSRGGGQEGGVRPGTENLPAACAFAEAVDELSPDDERRIGEINKAFRETIKGSKTKAVTPEENSTPFILALATPYPSEVAVRILSDKGFLVSSGSACSNNQRGKAEAAFRAAGLGDAAGNVIRVSFSRDTDPEEALQLAKAIAEL